MNLEKYLSKLLLILLIVLPGCACSNDKDKSVSKDIKQDLSVGNKEINKANKILVFNILDENLYNDCHITGSENVLFENIESRVNGLDKNQEIVVYCSNYRCTASGMAAKILENLGFKNVFAYEAGMAEWYQSNLPCTGSCSEKYLKDTISRQDVAGDSDETIKVISTKELSSKLGLKK